MLEFKTPEIDDKAWVDECFKYLKTMNCDYTFGNIFVWSTEYSTKISRFKDFFICSWGRGKETNFGVPIGTGNFKEAVGEKQVKKFVVMLLNMQKQMILNLAFTV